MFINHEDWGTSEKSRPKKMKYWHTKKTCFHISCLQSRYTSKNLPVKTTGLSGNTFVDITLGQATSVVSLQANSGDQPPVILGGPGFRSGVIKMIPYPAGNDHMGVSKNRGKTPNGWFIVENPIKMG